MGGRRPVNINIDSNENRGYIRYFRIQLYLLQMISNVQSEMKGIKLNTPLPTCFC